MDQLPSSIEAYLEEAGFSGTEILILRRLMDGEPLTIRQLGAKTGKSTGVLDQAMKKLMKKNIIKRTLINDQPKYTLDSLEAVVEWMQEDMEQKREMLLRRHQNFESFVTSLESGSKRPDIEYFEGDSGIKQAYIKLLNGPGEILHYLPVIHKEEEDPLRDFRVQYFRERQHRKMFSRVLAHDTVLGRRYQSRDAFEYRKTILISETEYPFTFEKIITGDRIACIDHKAKTACVIRYPELADVERTLFEAIWRQAQVSATAVATERPAVQEPAKEKIAFSTETLSKIREFFLSPKSIAAFLVCAILAFGTTYFFYQQNLHLNKLRIQERVKSIAATAALQFSVNDIDQIWTVNDVQKPQYAKLIHHLNRIRRENEGVKYAYIMRTGDGKGVWKFIADADALDPFTERDVNENGILDEADHLAPPGEIYLEPTQPEDQFFSLEEARFYEPASDQWGTVIAGSAPIRDPEGKAVALIGIDVDAQELQTLTNSQFAPFLYFLGFFVLFLIIRFAAYNRKIFLGLSPTAGIYDNFKNLAAQLFILKKIVYVTIFILMFVYWVVFAFYYYKKIHIQEELGHRLMAIAATAASQFDPEDLEKLHLARDMKTPEYQRVFKQLNEIRSRNEKIKWIYILRPTETENMWEFVADADTNYFLDSADDYNADGLISDNEVNVWPGRQYYYDWKVFNFALSSPSYTTEPETDQWGTFITGAAPIFQDGKPIAVLGIDMAIEDIK